MKAPNWWLWLGAEFANLGSNSRPTGTSVGRSYCEDEQQRQGHKGKLSWIV
jgi:hypothetical protein